MSVGVDALDGGVWYAAYGSNLSAERFRCYLQGGRPSGSRRRYPGCRDRTAPRDDRPIVAAGTMYFALESSVWGGGMAFYEAGRPGRALMRAYLVTRDQLLDVLTQEMHRDPADPSSRIEVPDGLGSDAVVRLGPGRYETVYRIADLDGLPVLTLSHGPLEELWTLNGPSSAYLRWVVAGLRESHGLQAPELVEYLLGCPGIGWARDALAPLVTAVAGRRDVRA